MDESILWFMENYGFGNYGDGIIKLIDPEDYMDSFYKWLGKEDYSRIPFMMTGFGDLFYFRNLGNGEYDISFLDIHYRNISVAAYTVEEFVEYLIDSEIEEKILRRKLFDESKDKFGVLPLNEIYFFAPALVTGGTEEIKYVMQPYIRAYCLIGANDFTLCNYVDAYIRCRYKEKLYLISLIGEISNLNA